MAGLGSIGLRMVNCRINVLKLCDKLYIHLYILKIINARSMHFSSFIIYYMNEFNFKLVRLIVSILIS